MTDRVDLLVEDIRRGPEAIGSLLAAYEAEVSPLARLLPLLEPDRRLAFTGLGSSRYAALIASSALRAGGRSAWVEYASTATPTAPADDLLLVAISASGRTPEVVASARRHRGRSVVIAVTNDPGSALADEADHVLPLHAGSEGAGIATRTFRATVAVLAMLAGRTPASLRPAVAGVSASLERGSEWVPRVADALDGATAIDVLADAALLGLAAQGALMLREAPRLPAAGHDTGDWLHTAMYLVVPGHRVLLYPGSAADAEVTATVERRGGLVLPMPVWAGRDQDPFLRTVVESLGAELLSAELWRRTSAEDR